MRPEYAIICTGSLSEQKGKKDEECAKNEPVKKEPNAIGRKA
jgi:hypothetical protein